MSNNNSLLIPIFDIIIVNRFRNRFGDIAGLHEWQQSNVEAEYIISKLAPEKIGTVLDPSTGSGTTGVACKKLGMSFVGIEIEKSRFEIAKANLLHKLYGNKNV